MSCTVLYLSLFLHLSNHTWSSWSGYIATRYVESSEYILTRPLPLLPRIRFRTLSFLLVFLSSLPVILIQVYKYSPKSI